jgi:nuclear transport factor 2 (NTF2) superfamily protein
MTVNNSYNISFGSIARVYEIKGETQNKINIKLIQLAQEYGCKNFPLANKKKIADSQYNIKKTNGRQYSLDEKIGFWDNKGNKTNQNNIIKPLETAESVVQNEYYFIKTFWDESGKRLGVIFADTKEDCGNINFTAGFDRIISSLNKILSQNSNINSSMKEVQKIDLIV